MLIISSSKLTGTPDSGGWAQVHEFVPSETEKLNKRGKLLAVVSTSKHEAGADTVLAGRELVGRLHEEYFGNLESPAFNALKNALEKVIHEFGENWGNVEIGAIVYLGGIIYSAVSGGCQVCIFRNGMLAKILVSEKGKTVSASGYPKERDLLLVATAGFFERIPNGVIKAALEAGSPELSVENLAPTVHGQEGSGNLGAIVAGFNEEISSFAAGRERPEAANKISSIILASKEKFASLLAGFPARHIYIRGERGEEGLGQQRKTTISVGIALILTLFVSIGFGIWQKRTKDERSKYETRLNEAEHKFQEASDLFSLNPERARELFGESEAVAKELLGAGVKDENLLVLSEKIKKERGRILGEYKIEAVQFLDLSLLSSGFSGDDLSSSGETIFVLDKNGKKIISIEIGSKKSEVVAGPDVVEEEAAIASYEERVFVLAESGIFEVENSRKKVIEKAWGEDVLVYIYAGNFYVLDKSAGTILRFSGSGESFSSGSRWLGAGVAPDFSDTLSIAIDGNIYVLFKNGRILKYTLGAPQAFSLSGIWPEIAAGDSFYTNEELKGIYILEKALNRVVVVDKEGKYKAQYVSDNIGAASDLVVSEKEKKIILLSGSKLLAIELRHF